MKTSKIFNGEILLPEPMIQHIQSFLTGKEAARTTVLSKSWYTAWLTRPTFDFDENDFNDSDVQLPKIGFAEVTTKNMQRYQDSDMKIDSFRLRLKTSSYTKSKSSERESENLANKLIASALKRGAKELDLDLRSGAVVLPREVLESEQLVRLSLNNMRTIDGNVNVRCLRLKSLSLHKVRLGSDAMIMDILSCCPLIEELSISLCTKRRPKMIDLSGMNMFKLHKLRRMFLEKVRFDRLFFSDFASRFPCLKDLSVSYCFYTWSEAIQIASTSLESMSFVKTRTLKADIDVPNLVRFRYSGEGIPSLCIESSREWESDVSIATHTHANSWYLRLKKLLTQLMPSKISLCISMRGFSEGDRVITIVCKPLVVENLTIDRPYSSWGYLPGLLSICRPKFLTTYWFTRSVDDNNLCKRMMAEITAPNRETSRQNMFGQLGLKEASVEVEERLGGQWQPLLLNEQLDALTTQDYDRMRTLRFRLREGTHVPENLKLRSLGPWDINLSPHKHLRQYQLVNKRTTQDFVADYITFSTHVG